MFIISDLISTRIMTIDMIDDHCAPKTELRDKILFYKRISHLICDISLPFHSIQTQILFDQKKLISYLQFSKYKILIHETTYKS